MSQKEQKLQHKYFDFLGRIKSKIKVPTIVNTTINSVEIAK
tara:strand:+ start:143 stop:265 length:123 start_codon:yes stop_codon:yes gene_type:complete